MSKTAVKPKSQILYDTLRDEGIKKKKATRIANGFVVSKRGDTSASRPTRKAGSSPRKKAVPARSKTHTAKRR